MFFSFLSNSWVPGNMHTFYKYSLDAYLMATWYVENCWNCCGRVRFQSIHLYIYTYIMDKLYYSILARTSRKKYIDDIIHFHPTGSHPENTDLTKQKYPWTPKLKVLHPQKLWVITTPKNEGNVGPHGNMYTYIYIYIFRNYLYIFLK